MTRLRLCLLVLLSALGLAAADPANALIPIITTEYTFTGVCGPRDCTGDGIGVLTLENYSLGLSILPSNFVSFSYASNLINFSIDSADLQSITGSLPMVLPAEANIRIEETGLSEVLLSETSGTWCAGKLCLADRGIASSWRVGGIPEPSTWAMMLLGFAGLGYVGISRRRKLAGALNQERLLFDE
jgi:hypothetical protein